MAQGILRRSAGEPEGVMLVVGCVRSLHVLNAATGWALCGRWVAPSDRYANTDNGWRTWLACESDRCSYCERFLPAAALALAAELEAARP